MEKNSPKESILQPFKKLLQSPCSDCKANPGYCVCEAVTPVLRYCQLFGVCPISLNASIRKNYVTKTVSSKLIKFQNADRDGGKNQTEAGCGGIPATTGKPSFCCFVSSSWKSVPFLLNILLLLSFLGVTVWMTFQIHEVLKVYFDGTDLYTFGTQTACLYIQCDIILLNSLLHRGEMCEIWKLLLGVLTNLTQEINEDHCYEELQKKSLDASTEEYTVAAAFLQNLRNGRTFHPSIWKFKNEREHAQEDPIQKDTAVRPGKRKSKLGKRLRYLRIFTFCAVAVSLVLSVGHTISFFKLVFRGCFDGSRHDSPVVGKPPCPFGSFFLLLQKLFYGMIDFVQHGAALLFGTLCIIIYIFFEEIEDQLEEILRDEFNIKSTGMSRQYLIENLRIAYEDLSRCCRLISHCFGLSVLAVSISSVVSITCALYSLALYSGAIEKEETTRIAKFLVIWAFHGWFGCFCLTLILLPGQLVTNASETPSQVIGRCALSQLDSETKYQLSLLQHQARHRVSLSACNITTIDLGFIAAAATNVTTYILVILQFRLGVEK